MIESCVEELTTGVTPGVTETTLVDEVRVKSGLLTSRVVAFAVTPGVKSVSPLYATL
jgi:hypothetical protein